MKHKRPSAVYIPNYINEFEKHLYRVKNYEADMSDNILAYRLMKNVNLKQSKEKLIKATINDLGYNLMKKQLKKIFRDLSSSSNNTLPLTKEVTVKTEETHQFERNSDSDTEEQLYTKSRNYKTAPSLNLHTMPKRKATNLKYIRGSAMAKTHLILKAI